MMKKYTKTKKAIKCNKCGSENTKLYISPKNVKRYDLFYYSEVHNKRNIKNYKKAWYIMHHRTTSNSILNLCGSKSEAIEIFKKKYTKKCELYTWDKKTKIGEIILGEKSK